LQGAFARADLPAKDRGAQGTSKNLLPLAMVIRGARIPFWAHVLCA